MTTGPFKLVPAITLAYESRKRLFLPPWQPTQDALNTGRTYCENEMPVGCGGIEDETLIGKRLLDLPPTITSTEPDRAPTGTFTTI